MPLPHASHYQKGSYKRISCNLPLSIILILNLLFFPDTAAIFKYAWYTAVVTHYINKPVLNIFEIITNHTLDIVFYPAAYRT